MIFFFWSRICCGCCRLHHRKSHRNPPTIVEIIDGTRVEYTEEEEVIKYLVQLSISSKFCMCVFHTNISFWQLFSSYIVHKKAAKTTFVWKNCTLNVDEVDGRCQFYQRFTYKFFVQTLFWQLFSSYILALAKKFIQKMRLYNVDQVAWYLCFAHLGYISQTPDIFF